MKTNVASVFVGITLSLLLAAPTLYSQSLNWNWTYSSPLYTGSGTFSTETTTLFEHNLNGYLITDITGSLNNEPIIALLAPVTLGGNDNLVADTIPQLDQNGISFSTPADDIHFFYTDLGGYEAYESGGPDDGGHSVFTAQIAPTPEPATTALMAMGALGVFVLRRRRIKR